MNLPVMNLTLDAKVVEEEILAKHRALETVAMASVPDNLSVKIENLESFAQATDLQLLTTIPFEFKSLHQGALSACSKLGFPPLDALLIASAWVRRTIRTQDFDLTTWPTERLDFGLTDFKSKQAFSPCPLNLGLYAVLPDAAWIQRMVGAGAPTLQLRFKSEDPLLIEKEIESSVRAVQAYTGDHSNAPRLFINDHWKLALKHGAYGVHLGQEDLEALTVEEFDELRASGLKLGLSTHGYSEMIRADALRPSYIAMGAIFPTTLKKMQTPPQGVGRLEQYAQLMRDYPLVAIGGITENDFQSILNTGVGSIAVVRAIVQDNNPELKAKELCDYIVSNSLVKTSA